MRRKRGKQITMIIKLHLIQIGIYQEEDRNRKFPEEEDAEVEKEDSSAAEDAMA